MAFDGSAVFAGIGDVYDVHVDLAHAYVSPSDESVTMQILDERRSHTLEAWAGTLIPGDDHWPSGSDINVSGYVDSTLVLAPNLRPLVLGVLDRADLLATAEGNETSLGDLSKEKRVHILSELERQDFVAFGLLKELTFESYYRHPLVTPVIQERTGFRTGLPVDGVGLAQFDDVLFMLPERDETWPEIRGIDL